ncbi:MAG: agmatine deiminase family protein [Flavobacteriales bacterium]|nr:agmatine deiminase family protein [Flavobacteriales bacterium]
MRLIFIVLILLFQQSNFFTQTNLPIQSTNEELSPKEIEKYKATYNSELKNVITTQPIGSLRTMAEWEEVQAICITWTGYKSILAQIVEEVQTECEVIVLCSNANSAQNELQNYGVSLSNVSFVPANYNSIWMRDYGGNTVYKDYVDSLILVDWIYNRSRPLDNTSPAAIGSFKGIPVYEMSQSGTDLVHTGGNFMADGFGTGFSSELVDEENSASGNYNLTNKTPAQVDQLMNDWMGIDNYIKMTVLPYDDIHHIDMHMKLLDEETLLVGEFPQGTSDGPQIEMNIQYIQDNYTSVFGTPFKIVRIPMVPSTSGGYPNGSWSGPSYRTYANNLIVNKKVLVPIYRTQYDTTGLRILREAMPGYEVIGIDCDNSGANIIGSGGAIHCITKAIGTSDPLLISHQELPNTVDELNPYTIDALIMHKSGIANASVYYKTDLSAVFSSVSMTNTTGDNWSADVPPQLAGTTIYYYISAQSNSGKSQIRPITAPDGYFDFNVSGFVDVPSLEIDFGRVFPNPSSGLTCIEIINAQPFNGSLSLVNVLGQTVETIHEGHFKGSARKYFLDVSNYNSGLYMLKLMNNKGLKTMPLLIK